MTKFWGWGLGATWGLATMCGLAMFEWWDSMPPDEDVGMAGIGTPWWFRSMWCFNLSRRANDCPQTSQVNGFICEIASKGNFFDKSLRLCNLGCICLMFIRIVKNPRKANLKTRARWPFAFFCFYKMWHIKTLCLIHTCSWTVVTWRSRLRAVWKLLLHKLQMK